MLSAHTFQQTSPRKVSPYGHRRLLRPLLFQTTQQLLLKKKLCIVGHTIYSYIYLHYQHPQDVILVCMRENKLGNLHVILLCQKGPHGVMHERECSV